MPGLEELTLSEKDACTELKRRIAGELTGQIKNDEYLFLRFLRARDFNLDLAETMLRNHIAWRRANQIDTILTKYTPEKVVLTYFPLSVIGYDKEGALVRYFDFGQMDSKGMLKSCKQSAAVKSIVSYFETDVQSMKKQSQKLGKPIQQWVYIFDFANYSFAKATHKPTVETLIQLFRIYEANYPERLKAAYIINSSVYFTIVFAIIKPLLSGHTLDKIVIYGKDGWKEQLQNTIDLNVLPQFLGGQKTDPDGNPLCHSVVKHGSLVPEKYFLTRSVERVKDKPGARKLFVSRKSKINLEFVVEVPGSVLEWEFETESKDIGFGLSYINTDLNKSNLVELIPKQRIDTHMTSETGVYVCDEAGMYIMTFDNSYSWIYQKEIYCKAEVIRPDTTAAENNDQLIN